MPPALPLVLTEEHLPLPELCAAGLDGVLRRVGPEWSSIDVPSTASVRAQSLMTALEPGLIVERRTAAWVLGADPVLARPLEMCVRSVRRMRVLPSEHRRVRQVVMTEEEFMTIGGIAVTRPFRTALDLIRWEPEFTRASRVCVATLLLSVNATPRDCVIALSRMPHLPHIQRALSRIARLPGFAAGRPP